MDKNENITEKRFFTGSVELETREDGKESRTVIGKIPFNTWSHNLGWFREKIDPGFFDGVMDQDTVALVNHDSGLVMARNKKTLTLEKKETHLEYRFDAPKSPNGDNLLESLKRGDIEGSSFQFIPSATEWRQSESDDKNIEEDRVLKECRELIDVGPVTFPAYPDSGADVAKRDYANYIKQNPRTPEPETPPTVTERELLREKINIKRKY